MVCLIDCACEQVRVLASKHATRHWVRALISADLLRVAERRVKFPNSQNFKHDASSFVDSHRIAIALSKSTAIIFEKIALSLLTGLTAIRAPLMRFALFCY